MKIGIDIRAIGQQRTGDETYTLQLVKSLVEKNKDNQYFLYTDIKDVDRLKKVKKLLDLKGKSAEIKTVEAGNRFFWTAWALPRQAKIDEVDILHVQYITPVFFLKNFKVITTVHDISFARYPQFIGKKDLYILRLSIARSLKKADGIIAVSEFTKKEIIDVYGVSEDKIFVVYNGGVAKEFLQEIDNERVLKFRKKYGIIKPYLLYLGTLQPRKNIAFLINLFLKFKLRYKGNELVDRLELVLRGSHKGRNYDQSIDEALTFVGQQNPKIQKQIKFVGYVSNDNMPVIFKGAEVFCFPSVYEGFGLPLLEAMSVGTPTIADDGSCFPEISAGATLLCKRNNYDDWMKGLYRLLTDDSLRSSLITAGKKRVDNFSWEKSAGETLDVYNKILDKE